MNTFIFILALALPHFIYSQLPQCRTGFFYKTLPLTADEAYIVNLEDAFRGYNIEYST
jgi:hypothetical protein